jgi:hypothetical protein
MGGVTVEEFTGVDVSDHWLDPLARGDWDRSRATPARGAAPEVPRTDMMQTRKAHSEASSEGD